ncbi:MAG: hypothetical protein FWF10_08345 [Clostridiales bacterium]|nr:hypothetical protein [Clostridiales bacterium]
MLNLIMNLIQDKKQPNMRQETHKKIFFNPVFFTRPRHAIICPRCGAVQSREQDYCCACKTAFYFLDETSKYAPGF